MALVTVQRSPSPSDTPDNLSSDHGDGVIDLDSSSKSPKRSQRYLQTRKRFRKCLTGIRFVSRLRLSESYLSFKGAALILPQSECLRTVTKGTNVDIQAHLQSMFCLLRPQDTIKMAIKLDSPEESLIRYMAVVTTTGVQDTEESVIIGVDIDKDEATIGLVLAVWGDTIINLNGDGGFHITSNQVQYIFKPVSVQAMWSAWQCLNKIRNYASVNGYYVSGLTHTWILFYKVTSSQQKVNIWNLMEDLESQRPETLDISEAECIETQVRTKLREIMMTEDLEEATSKMLRTKLEEVLNMSLQQHKHFIDQEMIVIMRQMDAPSQIFDYLYLGSEWNASNLDELHKNGVGYILNVTREIDNFFPGIFHYKNIRVYDVEESDLLRYWEDTYKFINKARRHKSKVLVHCKMGVSRSASTVISFAMKDNGWSLDEALKYVKGRRSVANPNAGFMKQLKTYEGILGASNQRHNKLWRSSSVGNMEPSREIDEDSETYFSDQHKARMGTRHDSYPSSMSRQQSSSLSDDVVDALMKDADLGTRESSETESLDTSFDDAESEPIQFLLDVDHDSSSQSIDDWEDVLVEKTEKETTAEKAGIVLIGHKSREYSVESDGEGDDSASEDDEEVAEEDVDTSRAAGSYNVEVLGAAQDHFLFGQDRGKNEVAFNLHPDMILEYVLSNQRRQLMSRREQLRKGQKESEPIEIRQEQKTQLATGTRVKADNSWIKEGVPTECTEEQPCTSGAEQESLSVQGERPASGSSPSSELTGEEMSLSEGAIVPYIKEAIPWSPGTVRRHAQDLECRMTTAEIPITDNTAPSQSSSRAESATPDLTGSPDSKKSPPMPSDQRPSSSTQDNPPDPKTSREVPVAQPGTPPSSHRLVTGSPKPGTPPSDRRPYNLQLSSPNSVHSESSHLSDSASTMSTPLDSPSQSPLRDTLQHESVYSAEDIQFVPGHVLRTRLEMEERERSQSFVERSPPKESRPVQRSASYKQYKEANRGRFDRTDDRRKTCLPVLPTRAYQDRSLSVTKSLDDVSLSVPLDLEQLKMDSDNVVTSRPPTETEQVQSQALDYEARQLEDATVAANPERSPIILDEGEVLIRHGSVKRTKQEMEERFGQSVPERDRNKAQNDLPVLDDQSESCPRPQTNKCLQNDELDVCAYDDQMIIDSVKVKVELEGFEEPMAPERHLKHSRSSPQLCIGDLAYPGEEEITWSVGTVRQQTQAFESISDTSGGGGLSNRSSPSRFTAEILTMIREVGTAWAMSPKPKAVEHQTSDSMTGPGMVKRLTDQIEGQSASKKIQKKLVLLENRNKEEKSFNLDMSLEDSEIASPHKSIPRSSSMREKSPRLKDLCQSSVIRSSSFQSSHISDGIEPVGRKAMHGKVITRTLSLSPGALDASVHTPKMNKENLPLEQGMDVDVARSPSKDVKFYLKQTQAVDVSSDLRRDKSVHRDLAPKKDVPPDEAPTITEPVLMHKKKKPEPESTVKNLRGKFEVTEPAETGKPLTKTSRLRLKDSLNEKRRRCKSSPESLNESHNVHRSSEPSRRMTAELTEVQQIVNSIESTNPTLDAAIKEKAVQKLFSDNAELSSKPNDNHTDGGKGHRYSRSMSSVPTVSIPVSVTSSESVALTSGYIYSGSSPTKPVPSCNTMAPTSPKTVPIFSAAQTPPRNDSPRGMNTPSPRNSPSLSLDLASDARKERRLHGKSHPLTKLSFQTTADGVLTSPSHNRTEDSIINMS